MKEGLVLILVAVAACGHVSSPTPSTSVAPDAQTQSVRVDCEARGNIVATGPTSAHVPVVVLYERSMWQSGFDVPSVLIWADGTVVYGDEPYGKSQRLFQATLSPESALEVQRTMLDRLRDARLRTAMSNGTDQPTVQIMFRDDDSWRVVESYGMTRTTNESDVPAALRDVFAAYRELLSRRPSGRVPAHSGYSRPKRWPEELPTFRGQLTVDQLARCARKVPWE